MIRKGFFAVMIIAVLLATFSAAIGAGSTAAATPAATATRATRAATTPRATATPRVSAVGPENFPAGVSPLTGLPVENEDNLDIPPVLVSITNFPVSARPQAGLSYSPFVYELYISEGMTRYLAAFYGDFPQPAEGVDGVNADGKFNQNAGIGPVRSGRLPYESLRSLMSGSLVMASADPRVKTGLSNFANTFGSDSSDINSAMIDATKLEEVAAANTKRLIDGQLGGLLFSETAPVGGVSAQKIWLAYSYLNQIIWKYDAADGSYHRFQDRADATTFEEMTDRLTGEPLTFENVIILYANHRVLSPTIIDVDLMGVKNNSALLFRDGKMYKIFWTTLNGEFEKETGLRRPMRFVDEKGNPVALAPGQTWVEIVPSFNPYYETVDSQNYSQLANGRQPGSGIWAVRFYAPAGAK